MDVKNLCELYGAEKRTAEALMQLAKETKNKGWWHTYGKTVPEWFELYVGLEAAASHLRWYDGDLITGLFQTSRYADAMVGLGPPVSKQERARRVEVRMARQSLLTRRTPKPPKLEVILDETTLLRSPPDPAVMAEQLRRLVDVSRMRQVTLRILPIAAGLHPGWTAVAGSRCWSSRPAATAKVNRRWSTPTRSPALGTGMIRTKWRRTIERGRASWRPACRQPSPLP